MEKPILFLVADDPGVLEALSADLSRRFGSDCRILHEASPAAGLSALGQLAGRSEPVALVIADQRMRGTTGVEFLSAAHRLLPSAKRILLVERDYTTANPIVPAMTLGQIDYHLVKPWVPSQGLYPAVSEFLSAWGASRDPDFVLFRVVVPVSSVRAHEIRDLMTRMHTTHACVPPESAEGARLLAESAPGAEAAPARLVLDRDVVLAGGEVALVTYDPQRRTLVLRRTVGDPRDP